MELRTSRFSADHLPLQQWLANAMVTIDELITEPSSVTEEITVHIAIVTVDDAPHRASMLSDIRVAPEPAMHADRGSKLLIPFAGVVALQCFIREHAGRTDFDQIPTELIFQHAICLASEEDNIP